MSGRSISSRRHIVESIRMSRDNAVWRVDCLCGIEIKGVSSVDLADRFAEHRRDSGVSRWAKDREPYVAPRVKFVARSQSKLVK